MMEASTRNWRGPLWKMEVRSGLSGALTLCGLALVVISIVAFGAVASVLRPDLKIGGLEVLVGLVLLIPLHEGVHALGYRAFGGRPKFGAGVSNFFVYAYVGCRGQHFSRNQFLVVALAPLVVLDVLGLALLPVLPAFGAGVVFMLIVFNTSGAIGDLWSVAIILQRPAWIHYVDSGTGFAAWAPAEEAGESAGLQPPVGLDVPFLAWAAGWVGISTLSFLIIEVLVSVLLFHFRRIWAGPLLLGEVIERTDGFTIQRYPLSSLAVAAAVGAVATVLVRAFRARLRRPTDKAAG